MVLFTTTSQLGPIISTPAPVIANPTTQQNNTSIAASSKATTDTITLSAEAQTSLSQTSTDPSDVGRESLAVQDAYTARYFAGFTLNATDQAYADIINSPTASINDKANAYLQQKTQFILATTSYCHWGGSAAQQEQNAQFLYEIRDSGLFTPTTPGLVETPAAVAQGASDAANLSIAAIEQKGGANVINSGTQLTSLQQAGTAVDLITSNLMWSISNGTNASLASDPKSANPNHIPGYIHGGSPISTETAIANSVLTTLKQLEASQINDSVPGSAAARYKDTILSLITAFKREAPALATAQTA